MNETLFVSRSYLLWGLALSIVGFIFFKMLYPFPDFFTDSYSYLFAAWTHMNVSIWPIGYSWFLAAIHMLSHSDTFLVACQYFLFQLAATCFFYSVIACFRISITIRLILFFFLFVNPLTLYPCNTVNSDALFGALSLAWMAMLIRIQYRPSLGLLFLQAIMLFLCFTVRNNAYYYPLISAAAFLLSRQSIRRKALGIILPLVLIIPFVLFTRQKCYELTGTKQYSLFTGWQLANNALYTFDKIHIDSADLPTPEARELHRRSVAFLRSVKKDRYRDVLESYTGNFFVKEPRAPLKTYSYDHYLIDNAKDAVVVWAKASAVFAPFGKYIIQHHPLAYLLYFVGPNIAHYFYPPLSNLEQYNQGNKDIEPLAQYWFGYTTPEVYSIPGDRQSFLWIYSWLFFIFNCSLILQSVFYFKNRKKGNADIGSHRSILLVGFFLIINLCFSLLATVNILRYQIVPMIVMLTTGLLLADTLRVNKAPDLLIPQKWYL